MQNRVKKCATVVLLAATTVAFVPMTAMADRAEAQHSRVDRGAKVKVVKQQRHRHAVGQRLRKQDVVVVQNWRARGLSRPGRNEVYVVDGNDIYLAAAATLLVKALVN